MTISEAKAKVNLDNDVEVTLLGYVGYLEGTIAKKDKQLKDLETKYEELKKTSEAHQGLVGDLYKQVDER